MEILDDSIREDTVHASINLELGTELCEQRQAVLLTRLKGTTWTHIHTERGLYIQRKTEGEYAVLVLMYIYIYKRCVMLVLFARIRTRERNKREEERVFCTCLSKFPPLFMIAEPPVGISKICSFEASHVIT